MPNFILDDVRDAHQLISSRRFRSTIRLMFLLIDQMSYILARQSKGQNDRQDFMAFVCDHILPHYCDCPKPLSDELWAARNGFVHSGAYRGQRAAKMKRSGGG